MTEEPSLLSLRKVNEEEMWTPFYMSARKRRRITGQPPCVFGILPQEILLDILLRLEASDIAKLSSVNKFCKKVCSNERIWSALYNRIPTDPLVGSSQGTWKFRYGILMYEKSRFLQR